MYKHSGKNVFTIIHSKSFLLTYRLTETLNKFVIHGIKIVIRIFFSISIKLH